MTALRGFKPTLRWFGKPDPDHRPAQDQVLERHRQSVGSPACDHQHRTGLAPVGQEFPCIVEQSGKLCAYCFAHFPCSQRGTTSRGLVRSMALAARTSSFGACIDAAFTPKPIIAMIIIRDANNSFMILSIDCIASTSRYRTWIEDYFEVPLSNRLSPSRSIMSILLAPSSSVT